MREFGINFGFCEANRRQDSTGHIDQGRYRHVDFHILLVLLVDWRLDLACVASDEELCHMIATTPPVCRGPPVAVGIILAL